MASCTITFAGSSPACTQSQNSAGLQGGPSRLVSQVSSHLGSPVTLAYKALHRNGSPFMLVSTVSVLLLLSWSVRGGFLKARDLHS